MPPLQRLSQTKPPLLAPPRSPQSVLAVRFRSTPSCVFRARPTRAGQHPPSPRLETTRPHLLASTLRIFSPQVRTGAREPCTHSFRHTYSARVHPCPPPASTHPSAAPKSGVRCIPRRVPSLNCRRPSLVRPSERLDRRPASTCRRYGCLHPISETGRGTTAQRLRSSRRDGRAGDRREGAVTTTTERSRRWSGSGGWERPSARDRLVRPRLDPRCVRAAERLTLRSAGQGASSLRSTS